MKTRQALKVLVADYMYGNETLDILAKLGDTTIKTMEHINEQFKGWQPLEILKAMNNPDSDFNPEHAYYKEHPDGALESSDYLSLLDADYDKVVDYIVDNNLLSATFDRNDIMYVFFCYTDADYDKDYDAFACAVSCLNLENAILDYNQWDDANQKLVDHAGTKRKGGRK